MTYAHAGGASSACGLVCGVIGRVKRIAAAGRIAINTRLSAKYFIRFCRGKPPDDTTDVASRQNRQPHDLAVANAPGSTRETMELLFDERKRPGIIRTDRHLRLRSNPAWKHRARHAHS